MTQALDLDAAFEANRPRMLAVAYRMLGERSDAEDVVQEAWLRWSAEPRDSVRDPGAFLVTMTSRLSLDRLRRVAARRESYVGEWLPEPVDTVIDPLDATVLAETISYGLLVVLETLSPLERVVYVLREAFGHSHAEIASMLDRSEAAIRQVASRARAHVQERSPRFTRDDSMARLAADRFLAAAAGGDLQPFLELLAPDVELVADGGGRVRAPRLPIHGAEKVSRFLEAILRRGTPADVVEHASLNGAPGVIVRTGGVPVAAMLVDAGEGRIARVYLIANPDKLARLGDVTSR
ncbi:MAG TPA: RNA polymerase sigma factor SigJ [Candidatus Limnocylindrales bacterium]|nr:RNA polymerase sigma factor SigJ [Candidatus Limnocylindrales bacterium]